MLRKSFQTLHGSAVRIGKQRVNGPAFILKQMPFREFSSTPSDSDDKGISSEIPQVDMSNFSPPPLPTDSALLDVAAELAVASPEAMGMNPKFLVMQLIDNVHLMGDIPYWTSIVAITIGLRFVLLPVAIKTVQNAARMAAMRPDMQRVQTAFTENPNQHDARVKLTFQNEMKSLFVKYKVNPLHSLMMPLAQFPIFIAFFMGLRDMGTFYPGFATGGAFWFTDLSAADPYVIFPIVNALSFLAMVELGSEGLQTSQQGTFKWVMRGISVVIAPLTMAMPQGLFVYWTANNFLSILQTVILKMEPVKQYFDIPKPPKAEDTPVLKMTNPVTKIMEAIQKERSQSADAKAEIVDGSKAPPPPPGPPPTTFSMPPRKSKGLKQ